MCKIVGSIVIVKFFTNSIENNNNSLITRTLKKIGVIDRNYTSDRHPANGELWRVNIVKEICENKNKGCFILNPLELVDPKTVLKLVPGMYEEEVINEILFIIPKSTFELHNCIIPLEFKRKLTSFRSVLVKLKEIL